MKPVYYIVSPHLNNQVTCMCRYAPDEVDVASRGELIVKAPDGEEPMALADVVYKEGKIMFEKKQIVEKRIDKEYRMIYDKMFKDTQKELQDGGVKFTEIKDYYKKPFIEKLENK